MPTENKTKAKEEGMGAEVIAGLVLTGIQFLFKYAPGIVTSIRTLINTDNPTDADFEKAKAQIAKDTYASIVSNSKLP